MAPISVNDLIGRTYLTQPADDRTRQRLTIVERLENMENKRNNDLNMITFCFHNNNKSLSEVMTYNQIIDKIESEDGHDKEWKFKAIMNHEGPLTTKIPQYKGSRWNLKIQCDNREIT